MNALDEHLSLFESLGFKLSTFEERRVAVLATPSGLVFEGALEAVLLELLEHREWPHNKRVEFLSDYVATDSSEGLLEEALKAGHIYRLEAGDLRRIISD